MRLPVADRLELVAEVVAAGLRRVEAAQKGRKRGERGRARAAAARRVRGGGGALRLDHLLAREAAQEAWGSG